MCPHLRGCDSREASAGAEARNRDHGWGPPCEPLQSNPPPSSGIPPSTGIYSRPRGWPRTGPSRSL
eukprot:31130-Pelagococcus_subviridis.AAC.2